jgi:cysteine synthase
MRIKEKENMKTINLTDIKTAANFQDQDGTRVLVCDTARAAEVAYACVAAQRGDEFHTLIARAALLEKILAAHSEGASQIELEDAEATLMGHCIRQNVSRMFNTSPDLAAFVKQFSGGEA